MIQNSDFWATLLWDNYLPFIESGAPFYLAADSILIHEWIRKYDSTISIDEALENFHRSCMSLVDRMSSKAIVTESAFTRIPGKAYSRVICLAVQQVLVVEKMLAHEQYSERSYFPRYRDLLGICGGSIHVNPIVGFQRIWSTLRNEIISVVGSSSSTITFCAGTGMDVNRNLPLSQALLTRHDLGILYQESAYALRRTETDEKAMIQILCKVGGNLNRRVRNLISKATVDERLRNRLCLQIQSFVAEDHTFSPRRKRSEPNEQRTLVAFLDTDSWLEDGYSVYWRSSDGSQTNEGPTAMELSSVFENRGESAIALLAREDCLEEIGAANPFEPGDLVIALIKANQKDYFVRRLSEFYNCALPVNQRSNLPEQYLLMYCGRLSNGCFFDPLGRRTKVISSRVLELIGGLIADGRSHTFLAGYPPRELKYNGNILAPNTEIVVNGIKLPAAGFFQKLENQRQLASYIIEFREGRLEFKISPTTGKEKSRFLFGFPLENKHLGPTAIALNEGQSSLRGAFFLENFEENEEPIIALTTADLITIVSKGERVRLSNCALDSLLDKIKLSPGNPQLINIALRQIKITRSVPIEALKAKCIRNLR